MEVLQSHYDTLSSLGKVRARSAVQEVKKPMPAVEPEPQSENTNSSNNSNSNSNSNHTYYWSKGTGFGNDDRSSSHHWDVHSFLNSQAENEKKVTEVVTTIVDTLKNFTESEAQADEQDVAIPVEVVQKLQDSCVLPFLIDRLQSNGITEMQRHEALFMAVLNACELMGHRSLVNALVAPCGPNEITLWKALSDAKSKAKKAIQREEKIAARLKIADGDNHQNDQAVAKRIVVVVDGLKAAMQAADLSDAEETSVSSVEDEPVPASPSPPADAPEANADHPAPANEQAKKPASEQKLEPVTDAEAKEQKLLDDQYVEFMQDQLYDEVEEFSHHKYRAQGTNTGATFGRKFVRRVAHEYADLAESLPCVAESSIYFRSLEEDMSSCQMMIVAPPDTPYGGGCFLFDISLPANYPTQAPKCNLQTTGGGSVRFNPNLYNCGKVCLSLLGTWDGDQSEKWNEKTSTLLQLAVSIQSLIFVPEPYFNEPGYEVEMGTDTGNERSDNYNLVIEEATMRWAMVDMLRNPPKGFEDIVRTHFKLRKNVILRQCKEWAQKPRRNLNSLVTQLEAELAKL